MQTVRYGFTSSWLKNAASKEADALHPDQCSKMSLVELWGLPILFVFIYIMYV